MLFRKWRQQGMDDRSPFGQFWFEPISAYSSTGVRVGPEAAMRLAACYACVALLAKTFAVLPFGLWKPEGRGKTPVRSHWLYKLIARRVNDFQTPFEWREMMQGHLALRGNGYNLICDGDAGEITDLLPMHPDRVRIERLKNEDWRYRFKQSDGRDLILRRDQVWHLKSLSSNGISGISLIESQRDVFGLALAAQEYGARFFANDGTPPGWIEYPGRFADEEKREFFRQNWEKRQTGRNRGKTAVLDSGMKYHPVEVKNSDAQYLEARGASVTEIARMFGVPPHLIGDLSKATFSNIEQQSIEFVTYTMIPIVKRWTSSIETYLLHDNEDLTADFDIAELLRGDQAARAAFYTKLFGVGAFSTNDIMQREGMNPVPEGDMRFRPVNLTPLDPDDVAMMAALGVPATPSQPGEGGEDEDRDSDAKPGNRESRLKALARAAVDRIARKELKELEGAAQLEPVYERHAHFISEALAVSEDEAREYCRRQMQAIAAAGGSLNGHFEQQTRARLTVLALRQA